MKQRYRNGEQAMWKGAVAGLAGGLVASWVMNQFQAAVSNLSQSSSPDEPQQQSRSSADKSADDDATEKAADAIARRVDGRPLTKHEKQRSGALIHYAFGSTLGTAYGAMTEMTPGAATGWGVPFGAAVWLVADEMAVPALGLSQPPTESPVSTHASALAAHFVYGATAETVRRAIRAML